jgi:hypothetical protein
MPVLDPKRPRKFVAVGRSILKGAEHVATCISHTLAVRIANLLNRYPAGPKGY